MPPKKLVRRAKKSLKERRINECLRDLESNYDKVELRKYRHDKAKRAANRKKAGKDHLIPRMTREVQAGIMTEELFNVERILHSRAGLPEPVPLATQLEQTRDIELKLKEQQQQRNESATTTSQNNNNSNSSMENSSGSMQIGLIDFSRFATVI